MFGNWSKFGTGSSKSGFKVRAYGSVNDKDDSYIKEVRSKKPLRGPTPFEYDNTEVKGWFQQEMLFTLVDACETYPELEDVFTGVAATSRAGDNTKFSNRVSLYHIVSKLGFINAENVSSLLYELGGNKYTKSWCSHLALQASVISQYIQYHLCSTEASG